MATMTKFETIKFASHDEEQPATRVVQARPNTEWEALERQDWHLWIFAVCLIFILGISLLSFMFPTVFWFGQELAISAPQRAFVGFCITLALVLVYLLQRQATVRRLKRELLGARTAVRDAQRKAAVEAYLNLPGRDQFRDGLAMEYRRASASGTGLSMILLTVRDASSQDMGLVTACVRRALRRGETLARLSDSTLAVILPKMGLNDATEFARQAEERISTDAPFLGIVSTVTTYPEQAVSLADLDGPCRNIPE